MPRIEAAMAPAPTPTPILNAAVCVTGVSDAPGVCWLVWLAELEGKTLVAKAMVDMDVALTLVDNELLEVGSVKVELCCILVGDEVLLETVKEVGVVTVDKVERVEGIDMVVDADELCAAELGTTDPVLVYCNPKTSMIVCAVPLGISNVPFPVSQLHNPSEMSG